MNEFMHISHRSGNQVSSNNNEMHHDKRIQICKTDRTQYRTVKFSRMLFGAMSSAMTEKHITESTFEYTCVWWVY